MLLRFIINFVRWSWGYPSLVMPETVTDSVVGLMLFGVLIDSSVLAMIIINIIFLVE